MVMIGRLADQVRAQTGHVGALQVDHPGAGAQPAAELTRAGVDVADAGRPGVEQGLSEAADRGAQVGRCVLPRRRVRAAGHAAR
jgi:hypothetical protein